MRSRRASELKRKKKRTATCGSSWACLRCNAAKTRKLFRPSKKPSRSIPQIRLSVTTSASHWFCSDKSMPQPLLFKAPSTKNRLARTFLRFRRTLGGFINAPTETKKPSRFGNGWRPLFLETNRSKKKLQVSSPKKALVKQPSKGTMLCPKAIRTSFVKSRWPFEQTNSAPRWDNATWH